MYKKKENKNWFQYSEWLLPETLARHGPRCYDHNYRYGRFGDIFQLEMKRGSCSWFFFLMFYVPFFFVFVFFFFVSVFFFFFLL